EALRRVGRDAVAGRESRAVSAGGGRGAAEGGGAVVVVHERHARRQLARLAERGGRGTGRSDREAPRHADRERGIVGAGEGWSLGDGEGEGLGGVGGDAIASGEGQGVSAAGARRRGTAERRGAIAVIDKAHTRRQGAALGKGSAGAPRSRDGERP